MESVWILYHKLEICLHSLAPGVRKKIVFLPVGDEPERISHLLLVELAECATALYIPVIHRIGLGRARRSAEVLDRACLAGMDFLSLSFGNQSKNVRLQDIVNIVFENISAVEFRNAYEFAARKHVAFCGNRKETASATARGDVAHEFSA